MNPKGKDACRAGSKLVDESDASTKQSGDRSAVRSSVGERESPEALDHRYELVRDVNIHPPVEP